MASIVCIYSRQAKASAWFLTQTYKLHKPGVATSVVSDSAGLRKGGTNCEDSGGHRPKRQSEGIEGGQC